MHGIYDVSVRVALTVVVTVGTLALLVVGCGSSSPKAAAPTPPAAPSKPTCAYPGGWQRLADRINADVYCPGWLPDPLTAQIRGKWNNMNSVDPDRSYLESFVWQETQVGINGVGGELHVNLRGYPGKTAIPRCLGGANDTTWISCFADPRGTVTANGLEATLYTVNQDADQWHVLLAWRHEGGLYTVSEHLAPPLNYRKLLVYLKHEFRSLVVISPSA